MTTYATLNPVPSTAAKDLLDNAENLDNWCNGNQLQYPDRFGVSRKSWAGIESDFQTFLINNGYVYTTPLDYAAGITISLPNQIFRKDGECYRAGPTLALPYVTTGVWATEGPLFRSVGDAALRTALAAAGGVTLVNGAVRQIASVAVLQATVGRYDGEVARLVQHTSGGLGGGSVYWDATSTATVDTGTTWAVTGQATGRWLRIPDRDFNYFDFGALGNWNGTTGNDDTAAVQNAINWAQKAHATLRHPALAQGRAFQLTAPLLITAGFNWVGEYVEPFVGLLSTTGVNTRGAGSWFHINHTGVGFYFYGGASGRTGGYMKGIGAYNNQPTPVVGGTFTPTANDWLFDVSRFDVMLEDVMMLNPTKGVRHRDGSFGRLQTKNLRGQPLSVGMQFEDTYDVCRIEKSHFWPFWSNVDSVETYTSINLSQYNLGRIDNAQFEGCFGIFSRRMFNIYQHPSGRCSKLLVSNCDADSTQSLITVSADGFTGSMVNVNQQSSDRAAVQAAIGVGGSGIEWSAGNDGDLSIANVELRGANKSNITMGNLVNRLHIDNLRMGSWGQTVAGAAGIDIQGNSNVFELSSSPRILNVIAGAGNAIGGVGVSLAQVEIPLYSGSVAGQLTNASGQILITVPDKAMAARNFVATNQGAILYHYSLLATSNTQIAVQCYNAAGTPLGANVSMFFNWEARF
jgi:hypothetical protein